MSPKGETDARALAELRAKIDAIDADIHRQLIARGSVIDSLVRIKGTSDPGKAFRPAREAEMMRRLVGRHEGVLPLATVEHIWREIITTFTRMQADFDVAIDLTVAPEEMRDLARFYFGFSVDLVPLTGATAVVAHVAETSDVGLVAVEQPAATGAWWRALTGAAAPRISALLPAIRAAGRPANLPAFVISPRLSDPTPPEVTLYAARGERKALKHAEVIARAGDETIVAVKGRLAKPGEDVIEIGGIFRGVAIDGPPSKLYETLMTDGAHP